MNLDLLNQVDQGSRYLGGEINQVVKPADEVRTTVALSYPDVYEVGMSHIGLKILYRILNEMPEVQAERVYAPWPDFEKLLRDRGEALRSLECQRKLAEFDLIGFTLQYELSYSNILTILDLGGVPLRAADRSDHPVVICGGPCAFNPEPLAPFMDAVCLGDGEEAIVAVVRAVQAWRASGADRPTLWRALAQIPGCYVPALYTPVRDDEGQVVDMAVSGGAPAVVRKALIQNLDQAPFPTAPVVPSRQVVHDRYGVEIQRGCMRGCRFCQAGYIYRPERQRSPETVRNLIREGLRKTGLEEYSLLSLSAGDYDCIEALLTTLMDEHEGSNTAISMPSMRLETLTPGLVSQIERVRQTSFTVAPEAASDRMRAVINKVIDEQALLDAVDIVFKHGWKSLKLYFMIGLPTERDSDLDAMVSLGRRCLERARKHRRGAKITVSVSSFVPKSHTPFQWCPQITLPEIQRRQRYLRTRLREAGVGFRCHDARESAAEGLFSRGGREMADLLQRAWELGARFDGWAEMFNDEAWAQACAEQDIDPAAWVSRRRDPEERLPWAHISTGMDPEWLWEDWMTSLEAGFVADCSTAPCYDCGVCDHTVVHNEIFDTDDAASAAVHRTRKRFRQPGRGAGATIIQLGRRERARRNAEVPTRQPDKRPQPRNHQQKFLKDTDPTTFPSTTRLPPAYRARLRINYRQTGRARFLPHLEVSSAWRRAVRRAGLDVIYSCGFHPHPRITFASPIPVGVAGLDEWVEIELRLPFDSEACARAIHETLPEGLEVIGVDVVASGSEALPARFAGAVYEVRWQDAALDEAEGLRQLRAGGAVIVERTRKKKTRRLDVGQLLLAREEFEDEQGRGLRFQLAHGCGLPLRSALGALFGEGIEPGQRLQVRRIRTLWARPPAPEIHADRAAAQPNG